MKNYHLIAIERDTMLYKEDGKGCTIASQLLTGGRIIYVDSIKQWQFPSAIPIQAEELELILENVKAYHEKTNFKVIMDITPYEKQSDWTEKFTKWFTN